MSLLRRFCVLFVLVLSAMVAQSSVAQTLWSEGAENGTMYVLDNTDSSYSLIQSNEVSEGSNAFHLANPGFQDNWFVLDQDITIANDTKLFFQSQLQYATTAQVAKVQISTNGGTSWTTDIWSQQGSGGSGEGAYGLRQVDLSSYASQSLRFRFMYDFTGGSAFTQTGTNFGWLVDDIQIGSELQKTEYMIGNPSAEATQYLEYINRARADAMVEAQRLANETDSDVVSSYNFFGVTSQEILDHFQWYVDNGHIDQYAQPLAFNDKLNLAAELHSLDMFNNSFQGHTSSSNPPAPFQPGDSLGDRLAAVGYSFSSAGENVFAYADSVAHGHAGFDVDWGNTTNTSSPAYNPAFAGWGIQNPSGHRISIHNNGFKEAGIGVINGSNGGVGPQIVTQEFASPGSVTYLTGVVYEDLNGNNFYDIGEGRSGVRIDVDGSGFYATSTASGAYTIPVPGDGTYMVDFSGGGFASYSTTATVTGGENIKVDYLAMTASSVPGDFDGDGFVGLSDLNILGNYWMQPVLAFQNGDANGDGMVDLLDLNIFGANWNPPPAVAVPEPAGVILLAFACLGVGGSRQRA